MNLVASLICREEMTRYLRACIGVLQTFCDEIRVVDDASTDGGFEWLAYEERVEVLQFSSSRFYLHEGKAREALLDWTMQAKPTHIVPLDCDELVADGPGLRAMIEERPDVPAWHLPIHEVWQADRERYFTREDGGWPQGRTLVWKVPPGPLKFPDRALACGRVPSQIRRLAAQHTHIPLLHLGWLDESTREARVARYTEHDGGRFHARSHLASILDASQVRLEGRAWPDGLLPWRDAILEHAKIAA